MNRTKRSDSPSSGPADGGQAHRPRGTSYRAHSNESRQESQYRSVRPLPRSSRADSHMDIAREEARSASISPERRWRVSESPSAAHPRSPQLDRLTHRVMRSPQVENNRRFPENSACQHGRPPGASPLADGRQNDIGLPQSSDGFSFSLQSTPVIAPHYGEPPRASGSQGPMRRESVQSPDTYLDSFSFDRSETQRNAPSPQTGMAIGDSFGPLRQSPALSHISLASSDETASVFSFDVNLMVVGSLGRSAHFASLPAPQPTVSSSTVSSSVENAIPGPSTQNQEGPNEEENGGDSQASSDDTLFETAMDHTSSPQADRSNAFNDSLSLSRPLSPLMVASTSRSLTHLSQSIRPSGFDTTTSSSPRVWPWWVPSLPQHGSPESSRSTTVTGLGLSIEGTLSPSPLGSHPPRHRTTTQAPPESPLRRLAGNVEGQSPTRSDAFLRDVHAFFRDAPASSQALASPPHLGSGASNLTPRSGGARSMNAATPSPRNVPLPSSPPTFTTPRSSPARLQAQPSHRTSPCMPFYPSLTIDDDARATPPGLDVAAVFERPTPRLSPSSSRVTVVRAPVPVASRTPSADPRSPISRLARLPGSIMEISRFARARFILLILRSAYCGLCRNLFFGRPTPPRGDSDVPIIP